jgi:hypothetical protein
VSKPFFYRINAAEFFTEVNKYRTARELEKFILQFAKDLITCSSASEYGQHVISEAINYIEKKKKAGSKGGQAKASNALAPLEQCYDFANSKTLARSSSSTEAVTIHKEKTLKPMSDYSDEFVQFWSAYPVKTGKGVAYKAWQKASPPIDAVLTALQWQITSVKWVEGYVPNPATYINQRRWEDEPSNIQRQAPKTFEQLQTEANHEASRRFLERMQNESRLSDIRPGNEQTGSDISHSVRRSEASVVLRSVVTAGKFGI